MTISVNNRIVGPFVATHGQTDFAFDFPIKTANDLYVLRRRSGAEALLVYGADYTLTLTLSGGTVKLLDGSTVGDQIVIVGLLPLQRSTQFTGYKSLPPSTIENEFDAIVKMLQEMRRDTDQTLKANYFDGSYDLDGKVLHDIGQGTLPGDAARISDISTFSSGLAAEQAARISADAGLQYDIDIEESIRSGADTTERNERVAGDQALKELFAIGMAGIATLDKVLATRATIALTNVDPTVNAILVLARAVAGDGGGGLYVRLPVAPSPVKAIHVQSADGAWWALYSQSGVNLKAIGGLSDGLGNNTALLNEALDVSSGVYLPAGDYLFHDYATLQRVLAASINGPGRLLYNNGTSVDEVGGTLLSGVHNAAGNNGEQTQGGFGIGGRGPGKDFTLLYAAHPQWVNLQPTYRGGGVEFQIYANAIEGIATTVAGTGYIDAIYGGFGFPELRVDDVIGYGSKLYRIKTLVSSTRIELQTVARGAVTFSSASSETFYHCFMYGTGKCKVDGVTVTRLSGDLFFRATKYADQSHIKIGATWHEVSSVDTQQKITLAASAGTITEATFIQRILPNSLEMNLIRLQGLKGGSEEGFAIYNTIHGRTVIETSYAGSGSYNDITFRTGPNVVGSREHMQILKDGRIVMGGWDAANPDYGYPLDVHALVWGDRLDVQGTDNADRTPVFGLFGTFSGNGRRYLECGFFANYNGAYLQSWVVPNVTPGITTINPLGGGVGFGTGARTVLPTDFEFVGGMQLTDSSFGLRIANTNTQQFRLDGKAGKAWRMVSTINGATDGSLVLQHSTDGFASNFTNAMELLPSGRIRLSLSIVGNYADDAAAQSGGVGLGDLYRTQSDLKIRSI